MKVLNGWRSVGLHDICKPKQWKTISSSELLDHGHLVYGANGPIGRYHSFNHEAPTILIGCRGTCGAVTVSEPRSWVTGNAMALDDLDTTVVDLRYVVQALRANGLKAVVTGTSQPQITQESLRRISIPIPPIEEQRRIASVLDSADALRTKRRQALEKLDTLTQSIFLDMFGPPDAPSVPCACLGELVRSPITRGVDQPGPDVKGGVPYIRTTDVTRGVTHRSELSTCSIEIAAPFSRSIVEYGDIVICIRATVGPTLRVGEALAGANLSRGTARIAPADSVRSEYLFAALNSEYFRRQVEGQLRGATFLQLPLGELRELSVPLPNLEQQDLFVDRWGAVERTMSQSVASLNHLNQLFLSLQHRAFRGEL